MIGRIVKQISNEYTVLVDDELYKCIPKGKFRKLNIRPTVGDIVKVDINDKIITEIHPRKNELIRPVITNVDQAVIVTSVKEPDFSTNLLDKLLVIIEYNNILPIICFTKLDLLNKEELININKYINYYESIGYQIYLNNDLDNIKEIFKDKITVFTGQTGAGKSTLLNKLDSSLDILTAPISQALGRGKHTTRHVELLPVLGGLIADTPGFSAISFDGMEIGDIRDNFIEFNKHRHDCKYKNCMHDREDECAIKNKVKDQTILKSRYDNYINFISKG
ncbi:MAG: ribosome small subunit-dependent GTPase A [Bacilli bacterium]|nr:ribosome small subunit-dependent GTPase A [Bacilli bacterium]MDD4282957.1 ribosome small subunit-dependent GTPase A [Bacilli bacterium]MDD4719028.1 ribosome small subunit-dependent GTPase A [Bacilli bacterium]